jgi:hypothetical protein
MRSCMSSISFGIFIGIAAGQVNSQQAAKPSALATVARQREARVIWSKELGRLEGGQAHAVFTALIVEDSTQHSKRPRGVRVDLTWPAGEGAIYIDEALLQPQQKIFDDLTRDLGTVEGSGETHWGFIGSCVFRDNPDVYPLVADFNYSGPESPALRIFGPKGEQIMFRGRTPSDLSRFSAARSTN